VTVRPPEEPRLPEEEPDLSPQVLREGGEELCADVVPREPPEEEDRGAEAVEPRPEEPLRDGAEAERLPELPRDGAE